jgi:hypothetical protein
MGYRRISKVLNEEGLKTPRGNVFFPNHVHSIYKKGLIREERMNRKDVVMVKDVSIQLIENPSQKLLESLSDKILVL